MIDMRTLKYALLGLLNQQSMTGYQLMKHFETTLREFWSANHSQIYPELKRLTEEGMIEYEIEISGTVLEKKLYTITKAGRESFLEWLSCDAPIGDTPKDVFRLRVFYSSSLPEHERLELLENHLVRHQARLNHLKNNQKKFESIPDKSTNEFGDYLVLMGAIMREEMTCDWIKKCIDLCKL